MSKDGKLGKRKGFFFAKGEKKKVTFQAFEDFCALRSMVRFKFKGRDVGGALLAHKNQHRLVFGFSCRGIHDTLRPEQVTTVCGRLESGFKELLSSGNMTVHLSSFASDEDRQADLDTVIRSAPSPELKLIMMSEKKRAQELAANGTRRVKKLMIYVSFDIGGDSKAGAEADLIEKILARLVALWESFKGKGSDLVVQKYEEIFKTAFIDGYERWESLLDIKMGLDVVPLSIEDLWSNIWHVFNRSPSPPVPNPLTFNGTSITEESNTDLDIKSILIRGELGVARTPEADRAWVRVKDRYVGILPFAAKPAGFAGMRAQLRYLWDILCRPHVVDTEIICQLSAANQVMVKTAMQRLLKQSNNAALAAADHRNIDVSANLRTRKTVEATEKILEGSMPLKVATVVVVHRQSKTKLSEACRAISECFQLPARVIRETEVAWQYWLQCHPLVCWEKLLAAPYSRHQTYLSNEAAGLVPFTMTRQISKHGFELIADDGGSPIHIDFIKEHRNIACFGTTRSGKSVAVSGMLSRFLASGYPIVCLDYPKPDGTSTFTDYAKFLEPHAAYFDIGTESNNLLEMPNLAGLSEAEREERFEDYKAFLESALVTMVLPNSEGQVLLEQTIRSLIGRALTKFFADESILGRYRAAEVGGFGSDAWQETPTLKDFMGFCSLEALDIDKAGPDINAAANQIMLQLDYWLHSRIGRAIGRPSSFPTDAQLLVFALRNLSNENEAAILSLSAYSAALRRALGSPKSIFFIDESPILFEYQTISQLIGRLCANGAKAGIRVMLSAQDPDTIMKSVAGAKVMQNMNVRLIGRIQSMAVEAFVRLLNYEREIIAKNATESFFPKRSELYSNWLLDIDGISIYCRYYPGAVQIAAVANNPDEQVARDRVLAQFRGRKLEGMARFAELYANAIRNGGSLDELGVMPITTARTQPLQPAERASVHPLSA
ncbi:MAG: hypothetical protein AAF827_15440 [Cyanobacteria bacterium P01_D01_bin.6]